MHLGYKLLAYSTITDWLIKLERGDDIIRRASSSGRPPDDRIDALITALLNIVRFIQCAHCVPPSSIHAQQYGDIWIPQVLLCAIYL
jgi:hypothetical protein